MPQIWMTYVELGSLLNCSAENAREQAIAFNADRKKSRDGLSRVKLNATWMELFINHIRGVDRFERVADELRVLPHMQPIVEPASGERKVQAA